MKQWWEPKTRAAVFPIRHHDDMSTRLDDLGSLGLTLVEQLFNPVALPFSLYVFLVPHNLTHVLNGDAENDQDGWAFLDAASIERIRVDVCPYPNTFIPTRFIPKSVMEKGPMKWLPCVLDWQKSHEAGEEVYIWKGKSSKGRGHTYKDDVEIATEWLDENYPDWRNPAAYFTTEKG